MPTVQSRAVVNNHAAKKVRFAPKMHIIDGKTEKIRNFDAT
jgi:hypothetical protein